MAPWDPNAVGSTAQSDNQGTARPGTNAVPSAARTATGNSAAFLCGPAEAINVLLDVTVVSGTTPSLTLSVEWSHDGTTWFPAETPDAFTAVTAAGKKAKNFLSKAPFYRLVWTISGTTPSFTFAAHVNYQDV